MTAVRNTLEDTMMKQEVGYGAIDDTNNPETTKTPTRTTYGILLLVISVFLVVGAGAAGVTRSSLRHDTASIVVSSERDSDDFVGADCNSCSYLSPDLKKAADLAQGNADAAAIVAAEAEAVDAAARAAAATASAVAIEANAVAIAATAAAENGGEKEKEALAIAIKEADEAAIAHIRSLAAVDTTTLASARANIASYDASRAAKVAAAALAAANEDHCCVRMDYYCC
ncbi:hypothetical protein FRACYDRAFT_260094 [Fragilariopsis cylindrus CCMP1102]|uniref:Uncharacterized protein n=1 Tax=Fragilariopsis cylindrus CCMP1102 TaxID=635003 RepID=A0A1E7FNQ6_9STRA|nr:hypothetical protein FRACYDRAFT_260094 [Fragilariopsis cylindrus CCMP1102]|eukprot:OEU19766.1 hypothetical protein FRACYDRAFT_260094 [Fragilariopsis cylindrus CCMP1102]